MEYTPMHQGITIGNLVQHAGDISDVWIPIEWTGHAGNKTYTGKVHGSQLTSRAQIMFCVPGTLSVDSDPAPWFICSMPNHLMMISSIAIVKTPSIGAPVAYDIWRGSAGLAGTHDGPNDAGTLTDSGASFMSSLVGLTINNGTDGSSGTISAVNSPTNLSVTLAGGTDNDWDAGDSYTIPLGGTISWTSIHTNSIPTGSYFSPESTSFTSNLVQHNQLLRLAVGGVGVTPAADLTVSLRVYPL